MPLFTVLFLATTWSPSCLHNWHTCNLAVKILQLADTVNVSFITLPIIQMALTKLADECVCGLKLFVLIYRSKYLVILSATQCAQATSGCSCDGKMEVPTRWFRGRMWCCKSLLIRRDRLSWWRMLRRPTMRKYCMQVLGYAKFFVHFLLCEGGGSWHLEISAIMMV